MPRKKKVTTVTEELPEGGEIIEAEASVFDPEGLDAEAQERLEKIREAAGGQSAKIRLKFYRTGFDKKPRYVFSDEKIDEDEIKEKRGGGSWTARVFVNGKYYESIPFEIEDEQPKTVANGTGVPVIDPSNPMQAVLQMQINMMQQHQQMLSGLLMKALGNGGAGGFTPVQELTQAMKDIHGMNGNPSADPMKMFEAGITLASKFAGGEKSTLGEVLDTVKEVLAPIVPALTQHFMGIKPPVNSQQITDGQPMQPTEEQITATVKNAIGELKKQALRGVPVELVMDWITAHHEEYQPILHAVVTTDFGDLAKKYDPEIGNEPLAAWFKSLYDGLRSAIAESSKLDDDSGGEDGNEDNLTDNG